MKFRNLGHNTGLKVSEIAFGTWLNVGGSSEELTLGSPLLSNDKQSEAVLKEAIDQEILFFDTAPGYSKGQAEVFLGNFLKDYNRSDYVVSTKVFFPTNFNVNRRGLSKKHIKASIVESLDRLQMDYVDLYYCHRFDYYTPLEETIKAMNELIDEGTILHWGTSMWLAHELERAYGIALAQGYEPPVCEQPNYSLLERFVELEHWHTLHYTGMRLTPYHPLAEGLLTGKYNQGGIPTESRLSKVDHQRTKELLDQYLPKLQLLEELANSEEITMAQLALAWVLDKPEVSSCITGASKPEHVRSNAEASELTLSPDIFTRVDEIMDNEPKIHPNYQTFNYKAFMRALDKHDGRHPSWKKPASN